MNKTFEELVKEKLESGRDPFEFDGWNCSDLENNDCDGWDGESSRCNCGNRRVYWALSDDKTYIYAIAD